LALAGRGELKGTIEARIGHLSLVTSAHLYGYLRGEVLKHFYQIGSIHVCPSLYEPFGIVAIEAMACGTPLIASRVGGLREIVSAPSVGRLHSPGDPEDLCRELLALASSAMDRTNLSRAGIEHVRQNYDWQYVAQKAIEQYQIALGNTN